MQHAVGTSSVELPFVWFIVDTISRKKTSEPEKNVLAKTLYSNAIFILSRLLQHLPCGASFCRCYMHGNCQQQVEHVHHVVEIRLKLDNSNTYVMICYQIEPYEYDDYQLQIYLVSIMVVHQFDHTNLWLYTIDMLFCYCNLFLTYQ